MKCTSESNNIICKLDAGENVAECISSVIEKYSIRTGAVLWAVGMIQDAEIGYLKNGTYIKDKMEQAMEVVSFHGSIASEEPRYHIHYSLADEDHNVHGGHFFSGTANPLLEIHIQKFEKIEMGRRFNEKSGLKELYIQ